MQILGAIYITHLRVEVPTKSTKIFQIFSNYKSENSELDLYFFSW